MRAIIILVIIVFFSCNNGNGKIKKNLNISDPKTIVYIKDDYSVRISMRDTIFQNKNYKCLIEYEHSKDTLNKYMLGENFRSVRYVFTYTDSLVKDIQTIREKLKDTIFNVSDLNTLYAENISFKKTGVNYLDGVLQDNMYLSLPNDSSKYRLLSNEYRLSFKVYVIDSLNR